MVIRIDAPDQLNTLQELAATIGDDENFATPTIKLKQSVLPGASAEGEIEWDTDKDCLVVGDGAGPAIFGQVTP